ncbi:lysine--tRNA ligase [Candidatus Daviesbacteria bacterium]|nr:lysine--tRNA ligase [Candidatus Daviesbacteria bacterium]
MYWADRVAGEIIKSGKYKPYWVDDMFTPSGFAHIGAIRGPLVHDLIYKALKRTGSDVKFTFVINDFDPVDGLPEVLQKDFSKYLGFPLRNVPSPEKGFDSFAAYFANDFKNVLKSLGIEPQYLSSYDMYKEGKFDEAIKIALDNADKIQDIYQKVSGSKKKEKGWLPLQVICEKCGKIGTTRVHDWDGKTVAYTCEKEMVKWAKGCGYSGRISPFGGNGKLPWKVDWPAHWMVIGVTIEGAGKDHASAGGSMDIARELVSQVFKINEPYNFPYEHFLIGGKKMASSKGLGFKARDSQNLLPPEVARFLFVRTDYKQALEFNPVGTMTIPDLFDEYDRCYKAYIENSDEDLSRIFEMSQINNLFAKEKTFLPRFRDIVNYIQMPNVDIFKKYEELKGEQLTETEINIINERIKYAKIWLEKYAPSEFNLQLSEILPEKVKELSEEQKLFLKKSIDLIAENDDPEKLQLALYNLTKELKIDAKKAFSAIYISLIGKEFGPKAAWFLLQYPKKEIIKKLEEATK